MWKKAGEKSEGGSISKLCKTFLKISELLKFINIPLRSINLKTKVSFSNRYQWYLVRKRLIKFSVCQWFSLRNKCKTPTKTKKIRKQLLRKWGDACHFDLQNLGKNCLQRRPNRDIYLGRTDILTIFSLPLSVTWYYSLFKNVLLLCPLRTILWFSSKFCTSLVALALR